MQKFDRVDRYLEKVDKQTDMAASKARASVRNYSYKLQLSQDMIRKFQGKGDKIKVQSPQSKEKDDKKINFGDKPIRNELVNGKRPARRQSVEQRIQEVVDEVAQQSLIEKVTKEQAREDAQEKVLQGQDVRESQYAAYMKGLRELTEDLADDRDYTHYQN